MNLTNCLAAFFAMSLCLYFVVPAANSQSSSGVEEESEVMESEEVHIEPDPQRGFCVDYWNRIYESEGTQMEVSARGRHSEVVVFECPECSLKEHYVELFLNTETGGKTGMERIKECGFEKAVFKGARGIEEIVVEVPVAFPDPRRLDCATRWDQYYERENKNIDVSVRGEEDSVLVLTCPRCASERFFINPYLNYEYRGKTGMDRIKNCGFQKVVFKSLNTGQEIQLEVPK